MRALTFLLDLTFTMAVLIATVKGRAWAANLVQFYAIAIYGVLQTIAYLGIQAMHKTDIERLRVSFRKARPLPQWIGVSFDLICIALLSAHGWFGLASLCLWSALVNAWVRDIRSEVEVSQ